MEENGMLIMKIIIIVVILINSVIMGLRTENYSAIILGVIVSIIISKPMDTFNILSESVATISEWVIPNFWYILWTNLGIIAFVLVLNLIRNRKKSMTEKRHYEN